MSLSSKALETLIDLVEIKLSCLEVYDRDDARELSNLENCLRELRVLAGHDPSEKAPVVNFPERSRTRGRSRAMAH